MSIRGSIIQQYGGLANAQKANQRQMGILEALGLGSGGPGYTAPIGPMQDGSAMPAESISPQDYQAAKDSALARFGNQLSTWGAGVSKASGPSRIPVSFGQALAGGQDALNSQDQQALANRKTEAEIGALGAKGPDFDAQLQQILVKENMGIPLTPQEIAHKQAWNDINQTKTTFGSDALGNVRAMPRVSLPGVGTYSPSNRPLPPGITQDKIEEYKKLRGM